MQLLHLAFPQLLPVSCNAHRSRVQLRDPREVWGTART